MASFAQRRTNLLRKWKDTIFDIMCEQAASDQWATWLTGPLEHAAAEGNADMVNDILAAGDDGMTGWTGHLGQDLLCAAVQSGKDEVVSALLSAGAQPDPVVDQAWSPLHHAAYHGHNTIAKLLLVAGADINYVNHDMWSPLHLAVRFGHDQVVLDLLVAGADLNSTDKFGDFPIHVAARLDHVRVVSLLLLKGADPNMLNDNNYPPLHLAAERGHLSVTKALLAGGADVRLKDDCGWSALDNAAWKCHVAVLQTLLQHGASVKARRVNGGTALHLAAQENCTGAINVLMEAGADVDARRECDTRPLHMACSNAHPQAVDLLLRWGADETVIGKEGNSAYELIGNSMKKKDKRLRAKDIERVRQLIVHAPADKAWRRRGLLVLCRSLPTKAQVGVSSNVAAGELIQQENTLSNIVTTKRGKTVDIAVAEDGGYTIGKVKAMIGMEEDGADPTGNVSSVEFRVVGLEQDSLFRLILNFL